eukprot:jgi/Botrbrau1/3472/Bobra.341_2s0004.1
MIELLTCFSCCCPLCHRFPPPSTHMWEWLCTKLGAASGGWTYRVWKSTGWDPVPLSRPQNNETLSLPATWFPNCLIQHSKKGGLVLRGGEM